ncbi:hypothetical protein [Bacillus sp. PS06]|uniref:hypothetical protein n=1 Tax=Bacillus sp. PS06 TaxID=2764176 RepID=UPI00177C29A8|nr:hypothetical protein [Bacillus sp. PS06]MBD8067630.1 hypothetical protein [Bacillus sp. PS06]
MFKRIFVLLFLSMVVSGCNDTTDQDKEIMELQTSISLEEAKEMIDYTSLGAQDKLISVEVENGEIKAMIEIAPGELFEADVLAVNRYSQLSDELLKRDDWETLTVEFVDVGTISMNHSEKETNEYGDYFPTAVIEQRLK